MGRITGGPGAARHSDTAEVLGKGRFAGQVEMGSRQTNGWGRSGDTGRSGPRDLVVLP